MERGFQDDTYPPHVRHPTDRVIHGIEKLRVQGLTIGAE